MELQLVALLLLAAPVTAPHARFASVAARSESISAVEASAARRFRWTEAATGSAASYADEISRAAPAIGSMLGVVRVARWIDSFPLGLEAQGGGWTLTLRFRV